MNIMYETERIILTPFDRSIAYNSDYENWFYDKDVTKYNHWGLFPQSRTKEEKFLDMCESGDSDLVLAIMIKEHNDHANHFDGLHIGNLSLQRINWIYRSAEYAITIGNKNYWNKGIGYEASLLLFYHGFERMNLHRIWTGTADLNIGMKELAIKLKMEYEGCLIDGMFLDGKYTDIYQYALLEEYWRGKELCQKAKNLMI